MVINPSLLLPYNEEWTLTYKGPANKSSMIGHNFEEVVARILRGWQSYEYATHEV